MTFFHSAAMPECGWLRKREYSYINVCDRERVLFFMTLLHSAAIPECGCLGKIEYSYSNVCDRVKLETPILEFNEPIRTITIALSLCGLE